MLFWGVCPWSHQSRKAKSLLDFCFWSCSKVLSKCLAVSRSSGTPLACHSHRWPVTHTGGLSPCFLSFYQPTNLSR